MTSSRPCSTSADDGGALARQRPKAQGKTLFASARKLIPQVIGEAFAEAHRRDPGDVRPMLAVVDGNNVRLREPPRPSVRCYRPHLTACPRVDATARFGASRRMARSGLRPHQVTGGERS